MSHDDPHGYRDRGAYTPPTDDELPFNRGGFDARRGPARRSPPVTLIVSGVVLLALIVAVALYYRSGLRGSSDAPAVVGTPVAGPTTVAPVDAQPIDPALDTGLYRDAPGEVLDQPTFAPPPEAALPRPAVPSPVPASPVAESPAATSPSRPTPAPSTPPPTVEPTRPPATPAPAPTPPAATSGGPAAGSAGVQIGAFSSPEAADREYAALSGQFPQYARLAQKRVQAVTTSAGNTVYRTTFQGLSRESAQSFCAAIRSRGGECLVR